MNSDTNSHISVLYSISQLNNPNIETPDEFADSEPSPSNNFQTNSSIFSTPPFQPIPPNNPFPSISTPSYASQVTPIYSSFHSDRSSNSPDTPQISQELDNFITLQQQPFHLSTPTIKPDFIHNRIIKPTYPYTLFSLYRIISTIIHTHRIIK